MAVPICGKSLSELQGSPGDEICPVWQKRYYYSGSVLCGTVPFFTY